MIACGVVGRLVECTRGKSKHTHVFKFIANEAGACLRLIMSNYAYDAWSDQVYLL